MHNCAKHAGDWLDIESVVNKIFSHFSGSSKGTEELRAVFAFIEEHYQDALRHVSTRWLKGYTKAGQLSRATSRHWERINVQRHRGDCLKRIKAMMGKPGAELHVYLSFLNNVLKIFHDVVLLLEGEDTSVCELYEIMFTLKTKLQQR